ncbi:MAG: hypothetical protein AAB697_02140 [Patescibacteria group bacterium]
MDRWIAIALGLLGTVLFSVAELSCFLIPTNSSVLGYYPASRQDYACIIASYKQEEPFEKDYSQVVNFSTNTAVASGTASISLSVSPSPSPAPPGTA